jgi:predicted aldo/keto reductase-like oxidoreductase
MKEDTAMNRRGFLKSVSTVAAGAAVLTTATADAKAPKGKKIPLTGKIPERRFGKTDHMLPVLGHGGSAMVDSWAPAYNVKKSSVEDRVTMVKRAYDTGVRYFDSARVYSESEGIMGEALKDVRDNIYLATKVADPRPEKVRASVEKSLSELKTDYVDCMQIHSPAIERVGPKGGMAMYEELAKLKDEGMIRFIGVTTHVAFETVYEMLDTGAFDQVLMALGYFNKGMDMMLSNANLEWREKCLARATELDMGVVAMKVMGLNVLGQGNRNVIADYDEKKRAALPAAAMKYCLSDERIHMLNIGMSTPSDIEANIKIMKGDLSYKSEDRMLLADFTSQAYESDFVKALKIV